MDQSKSCSPKLFMCTAIENKDEIEEVLSTFLQFSNKELFSRPCTVLISHIDVGGADVSVAPKLNFVE